MLKLVATAAVAVALVSGMPTVSQAGHDRARGDDCRLCKAWSDMRNRMAVRTERVARPLFTLPKLERAPREPLFRLAPREPRPAVSWFKRERAARPLLRMPKIDLGPRDPLFKLAPREPRPVMTFERRERTSLFTRRDRGTGTK